MRNYDDSDYSEFRKKVLKRDGRKCQMCGSKKKLHVHHIYRWADYHSLRYSTDNGITLCKDCHKKVTGQEDIYSGYLYGIASRNQEKQK